MIVALFPTAADAALSALAIISSFDASLATALSVPITAAPASSAGSRRLRMTFSGDGLDRVPQRWADVVGCSFGSAQRVTIRRPKIGEDRRNLLSGEGRGRRPRQAAQPFDSGLPATPRGGLLSGAGPR